MSKYHFINLIDKIFVSASVFLLLFAWINFYIGNIKVTFFLSLIFSFAVVFVIFHFFNKRKEKLANAKKYQKDVEDTFLAFRLMSSSQQLSLLDLIISKEHKTRIFNNSITCKNGEKKHSIIVFTEKEKLEQNDLLNLLKGREGFDIFEIICCDFADNLNTEILINTKIILTTKKRLFDDYFFKYKIFPDCSKLNTKKTKPSLKEICKNFFIPQKAKSYFLCGLVLIFSSVILPYHIYYLIFGSFMMLFAIISKLRPHFKR